MYEGFDIYSFFFWFSFILAGFGFVAWAVFLVILVLHLFDKVKSRAVLAALIIALLITFGAPCVCCSSIFLGSQSEEFRKEMAEKEGLDA